MSDTQELRGGESIVWKRVFLGVSIVLLFLLPILSRDYGQSGDSWLEIEYGQDIYNFFFHGDKQALSYENKNMQHQGLELYGGFFDYYTEVLHHAFPNTPILDFKNCCNAVVAAILMIFTGLFAYRISNKKWSVGVIALLFILFSPRILGEGMNNPKDIPHACGFVIGMYALVCLLQDFPNRLWRNALLIAVGFGLTFGSRPAGGLLQGCFFVLFIGLYYLLNRDFRAALSENHYKLSIKLGLFLAGALLVGFFIGLSSWPFGWVSPISHSIESLKGMTNRDIGIRVLFDGSYHYNYNEPWYYEFKWMLISNPIIVLTGIALFLVSLFFAKKRYGMFAVIVVLFSSFFPLLYMIYKHSSLHDTWRHVFFVYVYWVVMAAMGMDLITAYIKSEKLKWLPVGIALLGLIPSLIWIVRSYPNTYVYFNEIEGGVQAAYGNYDIDYYQNTNRQAANWILKNVKPIPGRKIIVMSNMAGFDKFFAKDTAWIGSDYLSFSNSSTKDWDYYVDYPRFLSTERLATNHWPPANVVHAIEVDGVPLSVIIKRKSNDCVLAYQALQKKDYATAAQKYAAYITTDSSDDIVYMNYAVALSALNNLDGAIAAMKKATEIDPGQAQFFQILAQLYQSRGDKDNAMMANGAMQALELREEEISRKEEPK